MASFKEVIQWYGSLENWVHKPSIPNSTPYSAGDTLSPAVVDGGYRAREVLKNHTNQCDVNESGVALIEWYADHRNWCKMDGQTPYSNSMSQAAIDSGKRARMFLTFCS